MKKRKHKIRLKSSVIIVFFIICLCVAIYSCYRLFMWKQNIDRNNEIKEQIGGYINVLENEKLKDKYNVDFASLKKINPDVVAWIKVNGTNIEYPVVKGNDNSYYLKHNFNKEYNIAGWIFSDYKNKFDSTDRNIVIYGHDLKDDSMFGTLKNVLEEDWSKNVSNTIIVLINENNSFIYQVFSTYSIKNEDYYTNTEFTSSDEFQKNINKIKSKSNFNYNVDVDSSDSILTLTNCIGDGSKRVVLHAKRIY